MSEFAVEVLPIRIEKHPDADRIELAVVGEYRSIVGKGTFKDGDLVAYIPEQAIVPDEILVELGLTGKLSGSNKNRVKAARFRGVLSQGICYPSRPEWVEGQDVTEILGIKKYEPKPPPSLTSKIFTGKKGSYFPDRTLKYDIENYKRFPNVLIDGEWVLITEKLHGTFVGYSLVDNEFGIFSKGLGAQGFLIDPNQERPGLYVEIARKFGIEDKMRRVLVASQPAFVLGEIFGQGVQDLQYGTHEPTLRVFDIRIGEYYMGPNFLRSICGEMDLEMVPILYEGPYSLEQTLKLRDGPDTISGAHMREGVVVRSTSERRDKRIGRVQLKFVSDDYLCRGGKTTEFN